MTKYHMWEFEYFGGGVPYKRVQRFTEPLTTTDQMQAHIDGMMASMAGTLWASANDIKSFKYIGAELKEENDGKARVHSLD